MQKGQTMRMTKPSSMRRGRRMLPKRLTMNPKAMAAAEFLTLEDAAAHFLKDGYMDLGIVCGTQTFRKGRDPVTAQYAGIWYHEGGWVAIQEY
jgi:hypothetical protein